VIKITASKIKAWSSLQSKMDDAKGSRSILAALPTDLSTRLFAGARPHRVAAGEPLFHAFSAFCASPILSLQFS
jgi:hypothetical protein